MDGSLSSGSESGPLVATLLADALLEQSWVATAPETSFAALDSSDPGFPGSFRPDFGARAAIRATLRELRRFTRASAALIALDGHGFGMRRRAHPDAAARPLFPPSVIHERVRSIGGTIRVVAPRAPGARLEIAARRRNRWNRGA